MTFYGKESVFSLVRQCELGHFTKVVSTGIGNRACRLSLLPIRWGLFSNVLLTGSPSPTLRTLETIRLHFLFVCVCLESQEARTKRGSESKPKTASMGRCIICGKVNGHAEGCPNSDNDVNRDNDFGMSGGEIRCSFCQTMNPPGSKKCRGCNASLEGSVIKHIGNENRFNERGYAESYETRPPTQKEESSAIGRNCPKCGYPLRPGSNECPQCSEKDQQKDQSQQKDAGQSVPIWNIENSEFRIGPCDKNGAISNAKTYTTDDIVLGREELYPDNNNISRQHIHITNENGHWYVEDVSSTHQTFITVKKKVQIENGDVLVLGNKFFRFETE